MKSKLNRRRGFTIAEIIMAVAIMGILIATVIKSLQSSKESIKADMVRAEMHKKVGLIKGRVEAAVIGGITPNAGLTNILRADDLKDFNGEAYTVAFTPGTPSEDYKLEIAPGAKGQALGITKETITWKK